MSNTDLQLQLSQLKIDLDSMEVVSYQCYAGDGCFDVLMTSGRHKMIVRFKRVAKAEFSSKGTLSKITSEISNDDFFISALKSINDNKPLITGNCLFCFYDKNNKSFLKIVARGYSMRVN